MKKRVLLLTPLLLSCGLFFYQAPPPLEKYPQRIPGKGWREILTETRPAPAALSTREQLLAECRALGAKLPDLTLQDRLARVDELIARNRDGEFDAEIATYLLELRELAADHAVLLAGQPYLRQREQLLGTWGGSSPEWIEKGLATCPPALEPNYRVQRAAMLLREGNQAAALAEFRAVMAAWPDHPRAEIACFMIGACLPSPAEIPYQFEYYLEFWRPGPVNDSFQAFEAYLASYPKGRLVADAHSRVAAVALELKRPGLAVKELLARWSSRSSRDDVRWVLRECEEIFAAVIKDPENGAYPREDGAGLPWAEMVKRPEVARLFVYLALDPAVRDGLPNLDRNLSSDGTTLNFLNRRILLPRPYVRTALLELGKAAVNVTDGKPDALTLLVLGWVAQTGNEPAQALALFDRALAMAKSDELLQGRAVALAALGRHEEAAATYQDLVESFPTSPLAKSTAFDRAIERARAGESGEALLDLLGRGLEPYGGLPQGEQLYPEFELRQWVDSIAQFGSLEGMAKPLANLPVDDPRAGLLRAVVRYRALAAHRFDLARQHLDPVAAEPAEPTGEPGFLAGYEIQPLLHMDEARWQRDVAPLAEAYQRLEASGGKDAAIHLEIGRRWKALRGKVTFPLERLFDYAMSENEKLDLLRRTNAAFMGVPAETIVKELDSRDELDHALAHFRMAAELSQDAEIAAPAMEEANEAIFRLAEFSHYRIARAVEADMAGLSARMAARLQADFPNRPEARRAAKWNFTPPLMMGRWMPGDYSRRDSEAAITRALGFPEAEPGALAWVTRTNMAEELVSIEAVQRRLQEQLADFNSRRPKLDEDTINHYGSKLDDLISAANLPGMTPMLFLGYEEMREGGPGAVLPASSGDSSKLEAHLEFLKRPYPDTVESLERYMARFPNSPKAEPASLLRLRLQVRAFAPVPEIRAFHFPEAPIIGGYKRLTRPRPVAAEVLEAAKRDLAAHEARFPGGRYAADIAELRAVVAAEMGDYETSLACLSSILADPMHPEMRRTTSLYFAEISLRLIDLNERAALANAFRKTPAALAWLRKLAYGDTCLFRLRPFIPWLEERTTSTPAPSPNTSTP